MHVVVAESARSRARRSARRSPSRGRRAPPPGASRRNRSTRTRAQRASTPASCRERRAPDQIDDARCPAAATILSHAPASRSPPAPTSTRTRRVRATPGRAITAATRSGGQRFAWPYAAPGANPTSRARGRHAVRRASSASARADGLAHVTSTRGGASSGANAEPADELRSSTPTDGRVPRGRGTRARQQPAARSPA